MNGPLEMTDELTKANMDWFTNLGEKLIDSGNPFNPDSEVQVSEVQVQHDADSVAGYCIVNAENLEEAIKIAQANPITTLKGCSVKVYETMPM